MKTRFIIVGLLCLAVVVAFAGILSAENEKTHNIELIISGSTLGKLKPCACSPESDAGGILRRETVISKLRTEYPSAIVVDAGRLFDPEPSPQNKIGARILLESLAALNYDAAAFSRPELLYGRVWLEHGPANLFSSNLRWAKGDKAHLKDRLVVERSGVQVGFIALNNPQDSYPGDQAVFVFEDPWQFLNEHTDKGQLNIVLCATDQKTAKHWLSHPNISGVINAPAEGDILTNPTWEKIGKKFYLETAIYGSRVSVLSLAVSGDELIGAQNRVVLLDKSYADGPKTSTLYGEYEAETKKIFLAKLAGQPAFDEQASPYSGTKSCIKCHKKQYRIWKRSAHAHAWQSLEKVNKTFDGECVSCHVVGWNQPGGFMSATDSPHLSDVGCEACHGPGKAHVKAGKGELEKADLGRCLGCHTTERSPAFDRKKAWKKIAH